MPGKTGAAAFCTHGIWEEDERLETKTYTVDTGKGPVTYHLTRKRVRNINLRIAPGGRIDVSAPKRVALREINTFINTRAAWITKTRDRLAGVQEPQRPTATNEECLALFTQVSDRIFPLFADVLGGRRPELKVRFMKSRWGVCHPAKKSITLNTRLYDKPIEAVEYVVLHEYVHFIHADHQAGFHAEMARLMPDYRERRRLLRK